MSRRGFTIKPCPGCGSTNERPQNKVCDNCEKLILLGKDYLKMQEDLKNNKDNIPAYIDTWGSNAFYLKKAHFDLEDRLGEKLGKLLQELALLISIPMPNEYTKFSLYPDSKMHAYNYPKKEEIKIFETRNGAQAKHIMFDNKRKADILNELRDTIEKALEEVEKAGIEYGKNVLLQLNKGDITLKDFEEEES
jgi:hypothetical protein